MPLVLSGDGAVGPLSATEVSYLDGVTSAVQTQLNGKYTTGGAWSAYTPTLTASTTNPTLGTGSTTSGFYAQIGKIVIGYFIVQFGTSGVNAGSGTYYVSLPVTAASSSSPVVGSVDLADASTGARATGVATQVTASTIQFEYDGGTYQGAMHNAPWAWAASDSIRVQFTYEAA